MIYGSDYSKFEVYTDSGLGTLTETILIGQNRGGFSGVTGESQNTPMKRRDLKYENPFTLTKTRVFTGYHYDAVLNIEAGDYKSPGAVSQAEDYAAEQATPRETDVHKAFRLVDYANAGYYILFTPHVDQAYVYGFTRYNVDLEIVGYTQGETIYADKCQLHVEGFSLLTGTNAASAPAQGQSARFAFGNCLSFASASSQYCTIPEFAVATGFTIEFWADITAGATAFPIFGDTAAHLKGQLYFNSAMTSLSYQGSSGALFNGGFSAASGKNLWHVTMIAGSPFTFTVYKNTVSQVSGQGAYTGFSTWYLGRNDTVYFNGKIAALRIYNYVLSAAQMALAYNRGYGNFAAPSSYGTRKAIWDMQGSGTTETDLTGGGNDLTLVNGVTRPVF